MGWPVGTQSGHGMGNRLDLSLGGLFCPISARKKSQPTRKLCPMTSPTRRPPMPFDDGRAQHRGTCSLSDSRAFPLLSLLRAQG